MHESEGSNSDGQGGESRSDSPLARAIEYLNEGGLSPCLARMQSDRLLLEMTSALAKLLGSIASEPQLLNSINNTPIRKSLTTTTGDLTISLTISTATSPSSATRNTGPIADNNVLLNELRSIVDEYGIETVRTYLEWVV